MYKRQAHGLRRFFRAHVPASAFVHDEYSAPDRSGGHFFPPTDLRSKTQGRGNYSMFFEKYEPVPKSVQEKVINEHKK